MRRWDGGTPKAAWPRSPQGCAGLSWTSMSSATRTTPSVRRPGDREARQGVEAQEDRLTEAQVVDAAGVVSPERPAQVGRVATGDHRQRCPHGRLDVGRERGQLVHLGLVRDDAALAGQVGPDAGQGQARQAGDGSRERHQVGRKHPLPEVAELHHQHDSVCRTEAGGGPGEGLEHRDLGVQAGRRMTYDGVDLADHGGADQGAWRVQAGVRPDVRGSRPWSRPGRWRLRDSMAAPTPGEPSEALVTPVTRMPRGASLSTRVRVLASIAPRSISRRGALIEGW